MHQSTRVLLVEDDPFAVRLIQEIIQDLCQLETVLTGEEAIKIIPSFNPHLILLDNTLPGMNGHEVCKKIHENKNLSGIKIIMTSAGATEKEIIKGYQSGIDFYLTKPFGHELLLSKIDEVLSLPGNK